MSDAREKLSYEQFGIAVRELAQLIKESDYEPDIILSIARGGLLIGGCLGLRARCKEYLHNVSRVLYRR
jgi:uncharacterized protein